MYHCCRFMQMLCSLHLTSSARHSDCKVHVRLFALSIIPGGQAQIWKESRKILHNILFSLTNSIASDK